MQLTIDFERVERCEEAEKRRREANRRELLKHLAAGGKRGLQAELIVHAANESSLVDREGSRRLVVRLSERAAAQRFGASKSGVHEALISLENAGLLQRKMGGYEVLWGEVLELEPVTDLPDLPGWSVGGRSVVGPLGTNTRTLPSHPSNPYPSPEILREPTTDRPAGGRLSYQLRWRHLFGEQQQPLRAGVLRLYREAIRLGWFAGVDPQAEFCELLGLVIWLPMKERREAGIDHPLSWMLAAVRDGREKMMSWPDDACFAKARDMCRRAEGLGAELDSICQVEPELATQCEGYR